jgi:hypothetical protein
MKATRKTAGRWGAAKKPAGGITKAKLKRGARKAKASLDVAAQDATLGAKPSSAEALGRGALNF